VHTRDWFSAATTVAVIGVLVFTLLSAMAAR
jgi:hypothetical protein